MCPVLVLSACQVAPRAAAPTYTPNLSATVTAVALTSGEYAPAPTPAPTVAVDVAFASAPQGWPNSLQGPVRFADGVYELAPQVPGQFVAIDAPLAGPVRDVSVSGRFHKSGGPSGGGYGLIVNDQGPELHDGTNQGGRFLVLEVGDDGTVGAWQRDQDRWIDLLPWTPNPVVHPGNARNDLTVRAQGPQITFVVNGTQVAQLTSDLTDGRVGVFVGGDGNQVVLERFAVLSSGSGVAGAAWPSPQADTPTAIELIGRLDGAWSRNDWPQVFSLLDQLERVSPTALDFRDKRYAAHMSAGQQWQAQGNKETALREFAAADSIDPSRGEAKAALQNLATGGSATASQAPQRLPSADRPLPELLRGIIDDVDQFWSGDFAEIGASYRPAIAHSYQGRVTTACGVAVSGVVGPFYCPLDGGLYLDTDFLQALREAAGEFPVAYVTAHEIGHHVQHLLGVTKVVDNARFGQPYSIEIELQADCLAGVWAQSASTRGLATPDDITQAIVVAWALGDPAGSSPIANDAHGDSNQRAEAFIQGFRGRGGSVACNQGNANPVGG